MLSRPLIPTSTVVSVDTQGLEEAQNPGEKAINIEIKLECVRLADVEDSSRELLIARLLGRVPRFARAAGCGGEPHILDVVSPNLTDADKDERRSGR